MPKSSIQAHNYAGSHDRYRRLVDKLGKRKDVAAALGIWPELLSRRCHGKAQLDRESYLAVRYLKAQFFPLRQRRERERAALKPHKCMFR